MTLSSGILIGCFALGILSSPHPEIADKTVSVKVVTEVGDFKIDLYPDKAPNTVANFLRYVKEGAYRDGIFHRTVTMKNQPDKMVKIEVIQGSVRKGFKDFSPIAIERTNTTSLRHLDGTISMARDKPDSATSDFFICIGDQPELDFGGKRNPDGQGFAAFGRVVDGMDIVMKIQARPAKGQSLDPPIKIKSMKVIS